MANELRLRADGVAGALDAALTISGTSLSSPSLADLPAVGSTQHAALSLFVRDAVSGRITARETVWVTAHTAAATTATILRAQEGTAAQAWASGARFVHGPTASDLTGLPLFESLVRNPLTSLAGFTSDAGTWTAQTDRITQSSTTANLKSRLFLLPTPVVLSRGIAEVEIRVDAVGTGTLRAGLIINGPATPGSGGFLTYLTVTATQSIDVSTEEDSVVGVATKTLPTPINHGTWIRLQVDYTPPNALVAANGAGLFLSGGVKTVGPNVGLYTLGVAASFRNLRLATPAIPVL